MSREAELLIDMWDTLHRECHKVVTEENYDVIKKAIKALEQQSITKNNLGVDCVSRERLKQIVFNITTEYDTETIHIDRLIDEIDNLPSVTPQESIIGKIRAEIENTMKYQYAVGENEYAEGFEKSLEIIDKYKADRSEENGNDD